MFAAGLALLVVFVVIESRIGDRWFRCGSSVRAPWSPETWWCCSSA